jgi:hypothetical protein
MVRRVLAKSVLIRLSTPSWSVARADVLSTADAFRISADNRCLLLVLVSTFCPLWLCLWMNHRIDTTQSGSPPHGVRADSRSTGDTVTDMTFRPRPAFRKYTPLLEKVVRTFPCSRRSETPKAPTCESRNHNPVMTKYPGRGTRVRHSRSRVANPQPTRSRPRSRRPPRLIPSPLQQGKRQPSIIGSGLIEEVEG